ncbi:MAG TPA: acetyl-CoA carboxylase biotin carboxylase subunit [Acidobacteriota bacterium]|nr:acetyl-CoA carboxylase biotin carboxylase subunit [Acidobacteriota bacterium]
MFKKILIANRGEIALRIICACKELGVPTVAVYSEADRHSLHVSFADEAVCIGPPRSSESYLNIPSIISAAEITNVDAIHPGYGYLSENSRFAELCETCGMKFIGPSPQAIELMGDKARARRTMQEAGLPIIPGSEALGEEDLSRLDGIAEKIGFPVIVKAAAGGGGRGMRIVSDPKQLQETVSTAQSEALGAFGSSEVYIEKYLVNPKHVEFQILADERGNIVHLGERECSVQRRHQKLLEETPSPAVTDEQRQTMGVRAVEAVRQIGYRNAGTMEFLMDAEGNFYFIEMNTRIQVEHPVTETVTGVDIVKEQIRIASGLELPFSQHQVRFQGHSIECRINAEDPATFRPSPGRITGYNPPGGPGIRVDSTAYQDWVVSPHYDSMIAKLVSYGSTRREAIDRMLRALDMFIVEGIETTISLQRKILNHPEFQAGRYGTSFLEDSGILKEARNQSRGVAPSA